MRLLILSSVAPDFRHFRANQTVLASLLESLSLAGVKTSVAVAATENRHMDDTQRARLEASGITIIDNSEFELEAIEDVSGLQRKGRYLGTLFSFSLEADYPKFCNPSAAVEKIVSFNPDAVLLFWDTAFEMVVPRLAKLGISVYGYLARPPQAAGKSNLAHFSNPLRRFFTATYLGMAEWRHLRRMRYLTNTANICALDASWYNAQGITSRYISNTWPDAFGPHWWDKRQQAQKTRSGLHILGNIGGLNATGNRFGIQYMSERVLPHLEQHLSGEWTINICGRFELPDELKPLLVNPHIALRGFVEDIDKEMTANSIFLLLNNAGPYTGGYTRVIYAFSSGACLIAHRKLADSMPELIHNKNCLLGETAEEIATLVSNAARDKLLRERLGHAARQTYETAYAPRHVAEKLIALTTQTGKSAE